MVNAEAYKFNQQHLYKRSQAVLVCFQDDLVCSLHLGGCYNVVGHKQPKFFYAWNIEEVVNLYGEYNTKKVYSATLPKQISYLLDLLRSNDCHSPWSFVTALASQIATDIYPASTLLHLKMGMLLNLAVRGSSQKKPVHLLAIGRDVLLAQRLLRRGGQLGQRYIEHFSPVFTCAVNGNTRVDEQGLQWTDAGPLTLAKNGVCCLGDWAKFSQHSKHTHIVSAIETGQISFRHHGNITEGVHTSPLECSVWTYCQHSPYSSKFSDQKQIRMLINIFGIPYLCDDSNETVEICQHILMKSILRTESELNNDDLREFLRIVSTKNLVLKEEARQLICSYFVACRRVRPDCLPVGAIETITALSEGHARLSMKSEVCYEDVLPVLRLYEESLYAIFGNSFVSPPPIARQSGLTSMKSLIMQAKTEMEHFSAWIINYIKSVIGVHPFQYCNAEE
ncbi:minichromosome maintenance domain-containing protein 2-like [Schistocerca gregaria]|uniref:minichromosome maintenance domain-containing protein 2-like n=1 Tax=Schistocerca gregaria TaxID=7010 RepID=UPI00211E527B|nr:minichromosome maintenance domain-containing protein 2-like [Schistocerca gregaria]